MEILAVLVFILLIVGAVTSASIGNDSQQAFAEVNECECGGADFQITKIPVHQFGSLGGRVFRHDIGKVCTQCGTVVAQRRG